MRKRLTFPLLEAEAPIGSSVLKIHGALENDAMKTDTHTKNLMTWNETCARLEVSSDEDDNALSSVIQEGYLTPIFLGEKTRFHRHQVERVAEVFGLGSEEKEAA